MPRVTLYIKDSDAAIWDRARALTSGSEDSLSSLVSEALDLLVTKREQLQQRAAGDTMEAIELEGVDRFDNEKPRKMRFVGVLAVEGSNFDIYITRGRKVILEERSPIAENRLSVWDSFNEFRDEVESERLPLSAAELTQVAEAMGIEYVEDID